MVSTRQSLAVEVAAMREDGDYLREQLDEGGSQLQIAHSRILTLEARIREYELQLQALQAVQDLLKEREDDCQVCSRVRTFIYLQASTRICCQDLS